MRSLPPSCRHSLPCHPPSAGGYTINGNARKEHKRPFWYGRRSGFASTRAQRFRTFPRSEIPPAFEAFDEFAQHAGAIAAAGELPDYTYLWWDIRRHPILGTVEVRALDSQSSVRSVAGIVALVHALARWAAEQHGPWEHRAVLMESSFRAARDGLSATLWHRGGLRPAAEVARSTIRLAQPYALEIGSESALEEINRLLAAARVPPAKWPRIRGVASRPCSHISRLKPQPSTCD